MLIFPSFVKPPKSLMFSFAKINSRDKSLNTWFAKISSREMKKKIWKTNSRKLLPLRYFIINQFFCALDPNRLYQALDPAISLVSEVIEDIQKHDDAKELEKKLAEESELLKGYIRDLKKTVT